MVGILAARWLVQLLARGFQENPDKLALTTLLARVMFPYLLFISLAALAMGILNAVRAFAAPVFSPLFLNIFIIIGAVWIAPYICRRSRRKRHEEP